VIVAVLVFAHGVCFKTGTPFRSYRMDHDDPSQRRVLGEQCRNAFSAGQTIVTYSLENQVRKE
jgi:hypothetical protein